MAGIKFPGEIFTPKKPNLEVPVSFDTTVVGGVEKYSSVSTTVISVSDVVAKGGDTMTGTLNFSAGGVSITTGRFKVSRTSVADDYSTDGEVLIAVTDTSSARTVTLSSADVENGRIIIVKDESGAAGTNNITIDTEASETIDGSASTSISSNYGVKRLYSDGTDWFSI